MKVTSSIRSLFFVLAVLLISACNPKVSEHYSDPGVSKELAEYRKENISDIEYSIRFAIPENKEEKITGVVVIKFNLSSVSRDLLLDFNVPNPEYELRANGNSNNTYLNEHIVIPTASLKKGENEVVIQFTAGDKSLNRNDEYLYTLFVPDRASTAFPCFDQPNLKAKFELNLLIPESWTAAANAPLIKEEIENGVKEMQFAKSHKLSTYLFSFAAGKFETITKEIDGREMKMLHRETNKELFERNKDEIFKLHADALKWLEDYTEVEYPFEKFDFVIIPFFQYGGMEHPGAILYRASRLFLDENATISQKLRRANLIAHETAHMWFGDYVTMQWFDDVWLKEVFAGFMADKIVNPNFPEVNHDLKFILAHFPASYAVDRTLGANPIGQDLDNMKNAGSLYGGIIYHKAPIAMNHLELMLGKEKLQEGIQEYVKSFAYDNATWDDLIAILDKRTDTDLNAWSDVWIKEAGMPTITAEQQEGKILIKQEDPHNKGRIWPQKVYTEFYNADISGEKMTLDFTEKELEITTKNPTPAYKLINHDGIAYGYFKHDKTDFAFIEENLIHFTNPRSKGVIWLNLFENTLNHEYDALDMIKLQIRSLEKEEDEQVIQLILSQLTTLFWQYLEIKERHEIAETLEARLLQRIRNSENPGIKKSFYNTLKNVAITLKTNSNFYNSWMKEIPFEGVILSENDMTNLAYELAIKLPSKSLEILPTQLKRIDNADRKAKMEFIMKALALTSEEQDQFFESLSHAENRAQEPWVSQALRYLHHPFRGDYSVKYLPKTLGLLYEIKITGDIFFPKSWLDASFWGHQSPEAYEVVQNFLNENPNYHEDLKLKILQATDHLRRNQWHNN